MWHVKERSSQKYKVLKSCGLHNKTLVFHCPFPRPKGFLYLPPLLPYKSDPVELDDVITPLLVTQQNESRIEFNATHHHRKWNKDNSKRQSQTAQGRRQLGSEVTLQGKDAEWYRAWIQLTPGPRATLESSDILMEKLSLPTWGRLLENKQNREVRHSVLVYRGWKHIQVFMGSGGANIRLM